MRTEELKLKADIDSLRTSINLIWQEVEIESDPERRAQLKRSIAEHYVPMLKEALEALERGPNA